MDEMAKECHSCGDFDFFTLEDISKYMKSQGVKDDKFQIYYKGRWYVAETVCNPWKWFMYSESGDLKEVECHINGWL